MKTLKTYINEYLNTNVKLKNKGFPALPIFYDVINYFKYNNFKIVNNKDLIGDPDHFLEKTMKDTEVPVCVYDNKLTIKDLCWMRIRNVGELNKNNPMLFFYTSMDKSCKDENDVISLAQQIEANFIGFDFTSRNKYYTWEDFKKVFYEIFKNSLN